MDVVLRPCYRPALFAAVIVISHHTACAQVPSDLSSDHGRLLASFDFEEQIRLDWSHLFLQEPSLPPKDLFFTAESDSLHAAEGERSIRFSLRGGSVSYRTAEHVLIPAQSNANYLARVWVRTEGLDAAAARFEVRIVDEDLVPDEVAGEETFDPVLVASIAEFASEPIRTQGEWVLLTLPFDTQGEAGRAGNNLRIVPSLQLVQPNFIAPLNSSRLMPFAEDVSGTAWFDGVEIWRMPSVDFYPFSEVTGRSNGGVGFVGDDFAVRLMVADPIDAAPKVELTLRDLDGNELHTDHFIAPPDGAMIDRSLPIKDPGWYDVHMRVQSGSDVIDERHHSILALRQPVRRTQRGVPRFGYSFEDWAMNELPAMGEMLSVLDPGVVEFALWPPSNDDASLGASIQPMRTLIDAQCRARRDVLLAIPRVHPSLAESAGTSPEDVGSVFMLEESVWAPLLEPWLLHFGTTIDRWRFVGNQDTPGIGSFPAKILSFMDELVVDPVLSIPAPIDSETWWDVPYLVASYAYTAGSQAKHIDTTAPATPTTFSVASPPTSWRHRDQLDEMAHRILAAWRGGAERVLAPIGEHEGGFTAPMLAWAMLGPALEGRFFQGELHASNTATCLVADGNNGMLLVAWSDQLNSSERIELPLGAERVMVDSVDGTSWSVPNSNGMHEIELTSTPIIIRNADRSVVYLASSMEFMPESLESRRGPQRINLFVENPFDFAIDGEVELIAPEGWSFEPSLSRLHIDAKESVQVPTLVRWAQIPNLGVHLIPVRLRLAGDEFVDARVQVPITVVSPGFDVEADWTIAKAGTSDDEAVVVTMAVTNRGVVAINLEATAVAWRVGRERTVISNLQPGERIVRRIQFNVDLDRLMGHDIRLSLHDVDGSAAVAIELPIVVTTGDTVLVVEE